MPTKRFAAWNAAHTRDRRKTVLALVSLAVALTVVPLPQAGLSEGVDRTPPSMPSNLQVTAVTASSISLAWSSTTRARRSQAYAVYRNGSLIATTRQRNYTFGALACGTSYTLGVAAYDAAGNRSAQSSLVAATSPCLDTSAPTSPTSVRVASTSSSSISTLWNPSSDNVGVRGYETFLNGSKIGSTALTSYTFTGLVCGTTYTVAVAAYDTAGNRSAKVTVQASTIACAPTPPPADTQPPTTPANLRTTATTANSVAVAWDASTDNTGVSGYGVYQNGAVVTTTTLKTATFAGLTCGTTYTLAVDATDAAGNRSGKTSISPTTSACPAPPPPPPGTGALTGAHWGAASDLSRFKQIGYAFDVATLNPSSPSSWPGILDAAQANGLKLIIGAYPAPYSYSNGQWSISAAGVNLLNYLASRSSLVLALFVYNEPYWISPTTGASSSCGAMSAADLRGLRTKIQSVWPSAKIYHDLGQPGAWAPGGSLYKSYSCIGNKYADQTGVADYVGVWDYPFERGGYQKARALATLSRETSYVLNSMHAIPVWLNQSHSASCCSLVFPTQSQILDWNCAVRKALPAGSLISWYVWRQSIYGDTLANHPEDWPLTTAAGCA
jgi:chitodextrinase